MLGLAKALKDMGAFICVISYQDGPLKQDFVRQNIHVFCLSYKKIKMIIAFLACFFDVVLCNTIVTYKVVDILKWQQKKLYWWLHEAGLVEDFIKNIPKADILIGTLQNCKNIFCVSEYSRTFFINYNKNIKVLNLMIEDEYFKYNTETKNEKFVVSYFGEIIPLKGQDIFLEYFLSLDEYTRNKYKIKFIGRICDKDFYAMLLEKIKNVENIEFLGGLKHIEAMKILASSDFFALFSRGDSFSISVAEAMMLNKPVIISDKVGIADIVNREKCGYIVKDKEEFLKIFKNLEKQCFNSPRTTFIKTFSKQSYYDYLAKLFL